MTVKDDWLYWICQIGGWGSYSALVFAVITAFEGWQPVILAGFLLFFCYSIGLTHLLRWIARRQRWLTFPGFQGVSRMFGAAVGIGLLEALLVLVISRVLQGGNAFDTTATISTVSGLIFMTCAWTAIYVGAHWYRRFRESELRETQTALSLRDAELRALQAQVNPHFLFNSLNTIRGTVRDNPQQAEQMITNLSSLFRRALRPESEKMIPLSEEMESVSDYLALESARFEERLQIRVELSSEAAPLRVPAMLVQTLVENAIKHGISKLPRGGTVSVRGAVENAFLIVEVENTGRFEESNGGGRHTGLANARQRLRLLCGDQASLSISDTNGNVCAKVVIPRVHESNHHR